MARDWDDAFANMDYIPGGAAYPDRWARASLAFRGSAVAQLDIPYGDGERQAFDLFSPEGPPKGLMVFIHGGYWMRFGKNDWSHLAQGALSRGYAVCLMGYTLTPEVEIAEITAEVSHGIAVAAGRFSGPIYLTGHSAGGHLALRQICDDSRLGADVLSRVAGVTGISGVHDLRPLLRTKLNDTLQLTKASAAAESPVLKRPAVDVPVTLWVGAEERPEFLRQNRLMGLMWDGLGADVRVVEDAGKHHFDVIEGLERPDSPMMRAVLGG